MKLINFFKNINKIAVIFLICTLICGIINIFCIYQTNWDFFSYHFYNGWAFLNHRYDTDLLPAMFRTYFNPLLDGILFLAIQKLNFHPFVFLFITGAGYGLLFFCAYLLFDFVFIEKNLEKIFIVAILILLTVMSPIILLSMNFGANDIFLNTIGLFAFYVFIKNLFENNSLKRNIFLMFSGFLIGSIIGLKYAQITYSTGIFACIIFNYKRIEKPIKTSLLIYFSMFLGFMLTGGWWMWLLWTKFHNPMFPYFNNIFHSPYADINSVYGYEFVHLRPKNILQFIFYPLRNTLNGNVGIENCFYDIKIPLTFISCITYFVILKFKKITSETLQIINLSVFNTVVIFTVSIYYTNLILFGNLRYILSVFALSSIIITVVCYILCKEVNNKKEGLYGFLIIILTLINFIDLESFGLFKYISIFTAIIAALLILLFYTNYDKLKNISKNFATALLIILITSSLTMKMTNSTFSNFYFKEIVTIRKAKIKDNSLVLCGTMLANSVIPEQNPNAKYIGMPVQKELVKNGFWNTKTVYKNIYFSDKTLEKYIKDLYQTNSDVYFIYAEWALGERKEDLKIYEKALAKYTNGKVKKINNCSRISYYIFDSNQIWNNIFICKIK